ncbi:hypothetical protein [Chamaesiphon minutus]|uniref:hypothetical protein n=1 Tax=Chamaesiphon minutus TaxID=1173032 RepID=UPI00059F6315|nr:hypothetical protein [Chamaesiphon minutus]
MATTGWVHSECQSCILGSIEPLYNLFFPPSIEYGLKLVIINTCNGLGIEDEIIWQKMGYRSSKKDRVSQVLTRSSI